MVDVSMKEDDFESLSKYAYSEAPLPSLRGQPEFGQHNKSGNKSFEESWSDLEDIEEVFDYLDKVKKKNSQFYQCCPLIFLAK